jgi:3-hydroxybenzoate 6-monooxygenase
VQAFQSYQNLRSVRAARVQISPLMMTKFNHAKGVERKVRNLLFEVVPRRNTTVA